MRILITGGAGFIGSHVADAFLEAGHRVAIVDDLSTGYRHNLNPGAAFYELSVRSEKVADVFDDVKPEWVYHFAAQISVTRSVEDPLFDADTNVLGTINLLENCVRRQVKRFVFSSSAGAVYGDPEELPATESCPTNPTSHYGVSKLAGEHYLRLYNRAYGLPFVILRYTNVFGPRQMAHGECGVCAVLTDLMLQGKQPTLYGFGEPLRDYVYVGDVARANVLASQKGDGQTLNIASGRGVSVREIYEVLKELTHFEGEPILKPARPGEVERTYAANDRARQVLGWEPRVSLREGLDLVVKRHGAASGQAL